VQDIPPYSTCVGYPTKVFGLNNEGLRRAGISKETKGQLHRAFRILFHAGLSMPHALEKAAQEVNHCREVDHLLEFIRHSTRGVCRA
jgi:UDP-N-acetylglucosamine acyltransferase